MTCRPDSSSVTHTAFPVRANKDGGLLKTPQRVERLATDIAQLPICRLDIRQPPAISGTPLRHRLVFGTGPRTLGHPQYDGALDLSPVLASTAVLSLAQLVFDERAGGWSGRAHRLSQFLLGLCRDVLRVGLANIMGDLVAVSAPTHDGKHAIPLRLRQLGGIVFTVLHPGAAR